MLMSNTKFDCNKITFQSKVDNLRLYLDVLLWPFCSWL